MTIIDDIKALFARMTSMFAATDALSLFLRMWVGKIFYTSGRTKVVMGEMPDPLLDLDQAIETMRDLTDDPAVFKAFEQVLTDDEGYYVSELIEFANDLAPNSGLTEAIQSAFAPSDFVAFFTPSENAILLFSDEYQVPLLDPAFAAQLATVGETLLPIMLFVGLGTRFAALGLLFMTFVIQIVYPGLFADHIVWFAALLGILFMGPGKAALDHLIAKRIA